MKKNYFERRPGDPDPLKGRVNRKVRFNEVDMLGIAWHGHYVSYFEDARVEVSNDYDIGYMALYDQGIKAPVKTVHVDFIRPVRFMDIITIEGIFHYSSAARINSEYAVYDSDGNTCATGYAIQMLLNSDNELMLTQPPYIRNFCKEWKAGRIR